MFVRRRTSAVVCALAGVILAAGCRSALAKYAGCPNGSAPTGESGSPLYYAQGGLTTVLWPGGKVPFSPNGPGEIRDDGSLAMKFPFWRGEGVRGALSIGSRRLGGDGSPATAEIPEGYGDTGFQASAIIFPGPGCWQITARAGGSTMTIVQWIEEPSG